MGKQFREGEKPKDIKTFKSKKQTILDVVSAAFDISKSEARRLVNQGGVKLDDTKIKDIETIIDKDCLIQLGKRRYKNIKII